MLTEALLVDNNRTTRHMFKELIEADPDMSVNAYSDAFQALQVAQKTHFDVVFVDLEMPFMNGIDLIREIRSLPSFSEVPIMMMTSIQDEGVRMKALKAGATDFLPKEPAATEVRVRIDNLIRLAKAVRKLNVRASNLSEEVAAATELLRAREEEIILRLALAVEYRDTDTGEHTLRVAKYSLLIAEELGLPPALCREIYLAAPLHDVGKVAVPDQILLKQGRLSEDEMSVIRTHTTVGGRILADSKCELIRLAASIASGHHERWDGSGYPLGLTSLEIPLSSRIVAVADVFDALTTKRPYKAAMPLKAARDYLLSKSAKEFDPGCVAAFVARWQEVIQIHAQSPANIDSAPKSAEGA